MKANELRVGNWIYEEGRHYRQWEPSDFTDYLNRDGEEISDKIEGIPLTPEILPELSGKFHLPIRIILGHVFFDYGNSYHLPKRLEYIHQFQNLYFALTGTELEYNPIKASVQRKIDSDFTEIKITDDTIFGRLNTK